MRNLYSSSLLSQHRSGTRKSDKRLSVKSAKWGLGPSTTLTLDKALHLAETQVGGRQEAGIFHRRAARIE